jgi:hypothetical protein
VRIRSSIAAVARSARTSSRRPLGVSLTSRCRRSPSLLRRATRPSDAFVAARTPLVGPDGYAATWSSPATSASTTTSGRTKRSTGLDRATATPRPRPDNATIATHHERPDPSHFLDTGQGLQSIPGFDVNLFLRHVISGSLALAFVIHTCRAHGATFPPTLTTTALDRSSSGWFAASACTAAAEGHQANNTRLLHLLHSTESSDLISYIQPPSTFVAHHRTRRERCRRTSARYRKSREAAVRCWQVKNRRAPSAGWRASPRRTPRSLRRRGRARRASRTSPARFR